MDKTRKENETLINGISINGVSIDKVHSTKFLGVIIDENIKWTEHIY